jgi:2-polyprenyl-3-methyl-5-hydroxy-6-metoxy-1,4-benzoquinol methylase
MNLVDLRKEFRKVIFPTDEILELFESYSFQNCLDIGAGTGFFLELIYNQNIIKEGIGVEINSSYWKKINENLSITSEDEVKKLNKKYDLIVFNDVLHHVNDKKSFLEYYLNNYLSDNGIVFIKDMNDENILCKYHNRLHDLIFAGEKISEISKKTLLEILNAYNIIDDGEKRIFLYDHYFMMLKK